MPFRPIFAKIRLKIRLGTTWPAGRFAVPTLMFMFVAGAPALVRAGQCPTSASEIATDRPDVTIGREAPGGAKSGPFENPDRYVGITYIDSEQHRISNYMRGEDRPGGTPLGRN